MNRGIIYGTILILIGSMSSCEIRKNQNQVSLEEEFASLRSWPAEGDLSSRDWSNYIRIAKLVQNANTEHVKQSIESFILNTADDEHGSKIFLLLRVIFELPENVSIEDLRSFKGWNNWEEAYLDGNRANYSWPIKWDSCKPALISNYRGSQGLPYYASSEYEYFLKKYTFRKLINCK